METSSGREVGWRAVRVVFLLVLTGLVIGAPSASAALYGFESGREGWDAFPAWDPGITNAAQSSFWAFGGSTNSLRLDCVLSNDGDKGWAGVSFAPQNLQGSQIIMRIYCPTGASGTHPQSWAWTQLRLWVKDTNYNYQETAWDSFRIPPGISTQTLTHTITATNGFDSTNVMQMGMQVYWRGYGTYRGSLYLDDAGFGARFQPPPPFSPPTNQQYSFDSSTEGFELQTWTDSRACTNLSRVASPPANTTACLGVDVHLIEGHTNFSKGETFVDMQQYLPCGVVIPANLSGGQATAWVYCPAGLAGPSTNPNTLQVFCKDADWKAFYGSPVHATEECWTAVSMIPATNQAPGGWMESGFDPTQVRLIGVKIAAGTGSGARYDGKLYVDGIGFTAIPEPVMTNDLRYGFEPNKEGWEPLNYVDLTGIVSVVQSTNYALEGTHSLRMNVDVSNTGSNRSKGVTKVDLVWFPPPSVRAPFNLDGSNIHAYVYCPEGSESTNPGSPNEVKLYVKSGTNYLSENGPASVLRNGMWVKVSLTPATNTPAGGYMTPGFSPTNIVEMGLEINMGNYHGALYLDNVGFPATPPPMPPSQHAYDFEAAYQQQWWRWDAAPVSWDAKAWTNAYYATNMGYNGSVALAADAHFADTSAPFSERKGVFTILYNPPLNLSTKTHRIFQAKVRFVPPVEGSAAFDTSLNVYDKITDQWYARFFKTGGSGWNILEFNLDDAAQYDQGRPPIPMDASRIGALTVQVFGNQAWTGTVYLDDVVIGGEESGTNYSVLASEFVRASGNHFILDGKRYYFAGANAEYMFSVYDSVCEELFDDTTNLHLGLVRTWAFHEGQEYSFQPRRGVWNELAFEHLDRIVAMAGHRGVRLLLGLADNWGHNGGMFQYVNWALAEHPESLNTNFPVGSVMYHDQFYANPYCRQWYRDFVTVLLNRTNSITKRTYKNDPTVFGWEIVNEPRCESDYTGATIHEWLNTMSDWVRSVDTNHLLAGGEEGGYVKTYDQADQVPWESYPDNYYHYGVHGVGEDYCTEVGCGRGHGVDFLSDLSSPSREVSWQGGTVTNRGPISSEWRSGNSNLNFTTCRIYVDQKEYNIWRTNVVGADQRIEWINDHTYDAHQVINKPLILEEFGIHSVGWIYNGSFGQVQFKRTPAYSVQDRVNVFQTYYDHIEATDMAGSFYWNMGYKNMWEDPFDLCESVGGWTPQPSAAVGVTGSTSFVIEGTNALKLSYNASATNTAIFSLDTEQQWIVREVDGQAKGVNRVKFLWNFYNPGPAIQMTLALRGTTNWTWADAPEQTLTTGWNKVVFDLSAEYWAVAAGGWKHNWSLIDVKDDRNKNLLEDIHQVDVVLSGLPAGAGAVHMDNVTITRDTGFVIFMDDPVCPAIRAHADRMAARCLPTNNPANQAPVASNLWIAVDSARPSPVRLGGFDPEGAPLSYNLVTRPARGWIFGTPPNMTYMPKPGSDGSDSFTYVVDDGTAKSAEAMVQLARTSLDVLQYDFETQSEGWYANYHTWTGYAVTSVVQTTALSLHGQGALKANVDLNANLYHDAGDAEVDMAYSPPIDVQAPVDLNGQTLKISVFCPAGARGSEAHPNRLQIYAKDMDWKAIYTVETNILENQWITYTMVVSTNAPPGGWKQDGFQPDRIRALGVRIKYGGAGSDYAGPIYIDAASFPVIGRVMYGFSSDLQGWSTEDRGSGHAALGWTNALGLPGAGAMVVTPAAGSGYGRFYIKDGDRFDHENLFYKPICRAWLWVPADAPAGIHNAPRVRLYLRSSVDGWSYNYTSDEFVLLAGQWNLITWDMSSVPLSILMDADEWGLDLVWPNRSAWSGPIVVDSIQNVEKVPASAPRIASVTAASNTVGKYQKFEVTVGLQNVQGVNPYNPHLVDLRATFRSPSGKSWNINGFYMEEQGSAFGQGTWRIRFAPNELGAWTYSVAVSRGPDSDAVSNRSFTCATSDRHGWIRVSDDDPHYFEHNDDTPFIGKGYCNCWDADDEGLFAASEEHGINMIHWWMAPWDTMLTVKPAYPWETWRDKSSYDTYEQNRAAKLDRVVGYAEKHSVKLVFTIWPHDAIRDYNYHKWRINGSWQRAFDGKYSEPEWYLNAFSELDDPPKNQKFFYDERYKEYQNRLYRYIIARWGYSEAIGTWALVSEMFGTFANSINCMNYQDPAWVTNKIAMFGEDPYEHLDFSQCDGNDYTIPWLTYINGYFKTNDPFGHPTTASYATDEYWEKGFPVVDVPQIHTYADLYNWITPPATVSKYHHFLREEYDKPAFMGEIGTVEWKTYEPDYARVTTWPALCSGAAITPLMWTTPAFSWFGDAKMGPWLDAMSDEIEVQAKFMGDIQFHKLGLAPAQVKTTVPGEPPVTLVESFEDGVHAWQRWGNGATNMLISTNHATHGTNTLRMDINLDTYAHMPEGACGIQKYADDGFSYDWSNYWPRGTLKMDVFIPEFYHPTNNPDGFLLGINKDPRSIVEIFTKDAGGNWHWYSTTNEYGGPGREKDGWKKLTVGMLWNLELPLSHIPTAYEAAHIAGMKFWFGDVGVLRGPIYLDNITAGLYAYNTYGMVSSNGHFAFAWIQDCTWSDGVVASNAVFEIQGLNPGNFNLEWWDTRLGIVTTYNASAAAGTLTATVPDFKKDIAVKIRRIGGGGATVHNVAVGAVREYDWVLRNSHQLVYVLVENRGTAAETFNVTLTDTTSGYVVGTNSVTLGAGGFTHTRFAWNSMLGPSDAFHSLTAYAAPVPGESDLSDNTLSGRIKVGSLPQPWDPCDRLRRWGPDSTGSDGRQVTVSTNRFTQGRESFEFYHRSPNKDGASLGFDNVYENWSNYSAFVFDLYVADGSTNVQVLLRTGTDWTWHFSRPMIVTNGWNRDLLFDFTSNAWTRVAWNPVTQSNEYYSDVPVAGLEEVQQIYIKLTGYPDEGVVYLDNMRLDGCYILHLGYLDDMDFFPRAAAEQTNYTAAACCWMIARYLNGETFAQTQQQIYDATAHDPAHNNEITPAGCASWMLSNIEPGYYFDDRYQTNLDVALRETVYWMDYIPPGGLQTPVYIVCGTNWSYKVVRGFHANKKPYGSGEWGCWLDPKYFAVYGMWLNDPAVNGLGYNLYVSATEMAGIFRPSMANGQYWFIAEPPQDAARVAQAEDAIENSVMTLEPAAPNPVLASFLKSKFEPPGPRRRSGGGDPDLLASIPPALRGDGGFMNAFNAASVANYYAANTNRSDIYYLAAGGERGPGSTRYVLKLATNGALLQATWCDAPTFYQPLPLSTADWAARRQFAPGSTVTLRSNELISLPGLSPFMPAWELVYSVNGTSVFSEVRADVDLGGDADGDGMSDGEELYSGLNPTNGLSVFSVEGGTLHSLGPDKLLISWPSATNKTYGLYRSSDLRQPFSGVAVNIPATPPMNTYTDQPPSATTYYRVVVE